MPATYAGGSKGTARQAASNKEACDKQAHYPFLRNDDQLYEWALAEAKTLPGLHKSVNKAGTLVHQLDVGLWPDFIKAPANPTFDPELCSTTLSPTPFRAASMRVVFWAPHIFWNRHLLNNKPACPVCKCSKGVACHGWAPQLRRLCGLGVSWFILGYRYQCKECPGVWVVVCCNTF